MSRPNASRRGYSARWRRESTEYLRQNPWCAPCKRAGRKTRATLVHHKTPHRGNPALFWATANWEGRCRTCHDDATGPEKTGRDEWYRGAGIDGTPLDPNHRWNRA